MEVLLVVRRAGGADELQQGVEALLEARLVAGLDRRDDGVVELVEARVVIAKKTFDLAFRLV